MKNLLLLFILFVCSAKVSMNVAFSQCNVNTSICTSGTAGPFGFVTPGNYVSTCLDWFGPNTGYILLNITTSGPLNMLINGNASSGYLDVAVFNIPNGVAPCTAIQNTSNQIGCNYATYSSGCNQFGTSFPCTSSVPAPNVTAGQTLMIVVENWSGSSSTFTMQLGATGAQTGPPNPAINPAGPFCSTQGNTQLTAVNQGGTWSGPGVSSSGMFNPSAAGPGVHTINYSIGTAPCNSTSSAQITVNAPGVITLSPSSTSVCSGNSATLIASGASNFTWSPAATLSASTGATVNASPTVTTTYTVNATPTGCVTPASVTVTVNPLPNASAGTAQVISCGSSTVTLNGSSSTAGTTFSWSGPGIVSGGNTATPVVNAVGTYTIDVTSPAGCHKTATVTVTQNNTQPNANAGTAQTIPCGGSSVVLNGSSSTAGTTYSWSGPGIVSGGNTLTPSVNVAGVYTLTVTNPANGCTNTSTVTAINNSAVPTASIGIAANLTCTNTSTALSGSSTTSGVTYSWSGPGVSSGGSTSTPTVNMPGTYTLTVMNPSGGCTNTATITVNQNIIPPTANAGGTQVLTCTTISANLSGSTSSGATYVWSGPGISSGGNTLNPTINAAGTYTITATNPVNGCTASSNVTVTSNVTVPNANAGAAQTIPCGGSSAVLNGSSTTAGVSYSWTGPGIVSGGNTATPSVNVSGAYTLTVTNPSNGCVNTSTVNAVNNSVVPSATIASSSNLTCVQTNISLSGSSTTSGVTYSWSGPGIISGGNTSSPSINMPGNYILTVINPSSGCTNTATTTVVQDIIPPTANAGGPAMLTCIATSLSLSGSMSSGSTCVWSGPGITSGANTTYPTVNATGTYVFTVTNPANGCIATSSMSVSSNISLPNANAGADQILTCLTPTLTLLGNSTTSGVIFSWTGPVVVSGGATATPSVNQAGMYVLTVTNPTNGCSATDDVQVLLNNTAPINQMNSATQVGCVPFAVSINETSGLNNVYTWNFGDGTSGIGSSVQHTYTGTNCFDITLTVTDPSNGCSSTQIYAQVVCVSDYPVANFTFYPPTIDPSDPEITFTNLSQDATVYSWDFGDVTSSSDDDPIHTYLNPHDNYTIVLEASNGICSTSVEHVIQIVEPIIFYVPNSFTPDGDFYNQVFQPIITSGIEIQNFTFVIYNRWGEMVWESHDASIGWDGNYGGSIVKEGVYTWSMKFKLNNIDKYEEYQGIVNLMR